MKLTLLAFLLAFLLAQAWASPRAKRASSFKWFGSNVSGAEFGQGNIPGTLGTDYIWPSASDITPLVNAGMNIFRVPFLMERLVPDNLTGEADATYMADLKATVKTITDLGAYAVVDPHNFGRYYGEIITSTSDFGAFWTTVAKEFTDNDLVIFDTNNEYHDMDQTLVLNLSQAAINSIRSVATSQYIFIEGNSYSGAWTWTTTNTNLGNLTDPSNKLIYEMHQYLDSDGSGTSSTCVSSTIGAERVADATTWLKENGKLGVLGEFAGGANTVCEDAVVGMLSALEEASDVWLGSGGVAYEYYLDVLEGYTPGGATGTSSGVGSATSTATKVSTTTAAATTTVTATATGTAAHYAQCGGDGWTGATTCADGYTCTKMNEYYSQCL
ncbi:glycoside hydrolase [Aspergillus sclerotioniger CBS 115572]|uniref:cellulase n=1 Tax=Aspergillus sclerotioniger CBS 115572 TaxID=1450535 RepID=A0A317XA30_9EURO|nr:glycoside hydrolase [Aspergillus sclerotioniger CBS 115572]PWY95434.1 glycoside hydrolase [Aspergillus sclerotioniger CBS 115572]